MRYRGITQCIAFAITFSSASFPWIFLVGFVGIMMIIDKLTSTEIG